MENDILGKNSLIDEERLLKAKEYEEELTVIPTKGMFYKVITVVAISMSLFHLYVAVIPVTTQKLRGIHLAFVFFLSFLLYPSLKRYKNRFFWPDVVLAIFAISPIVYLLLNFENFIYRVITPTNLDLFFGIAIILLVLEASRRSCGIAMPVIAIIFLIYAVTGQYFPAPWTHRGYDVERIVGLMYMTLEGIFGVPIAVSSTFIILFTIYGAFLAESGAGKFFIDFALSVMGRGPAAAGRTVTVASFLLGGPSGSGTATTVTLATVAYPMLVKSGYSKDEAGGLLAAGGIGAVLSPPILGAAAFIICEMLRISYLDVITLATIPTVLFYWSIFLMVEFDSRKFGKRKIEFSLSESLGSITSKYWFHFTSLFAVIVLMFFGLTPIYAVFWSIVISFFTSFIRQDTALYYPSRLINALRDGSVKVLGVASICACAGIIVGVTTLTGIGLKFSFIILKYAGNSLLLTAIYSAVICWVIGLAVPVTATYIICVVLIAPAFITLGVPDYAAHMFVFYYAVLSEVSPPTALAPFAAAALTGGNPYKTTMYSWKYTLPAFLVPFTFTIHPEGIGLLLRGPFFMVLENIISSLIGIMALAGGVVGWFLKKTTLIERVLLIVSGLILVYPALIYDLVGLGLLGITISMQIFRKVNISSS